MTDLETQFPLTTQEKTPPPMAKTSRLFQTWAGKQGFSLVMAEHMDPEGNLLESIDITASAPIRSAEIDPPTESQWHPSLDQTGQGLLLSQGLLEKTIESLSSAAYSSGSFVEAGGLTIGKYCHTKDQIPYSTAQYYLPMPKNAEFASGDAGASSGHITFTAEAFMLFFQAIDQFHHERGLAPGSLNLTSWVHCHPGVAFESIVDSQGHSTVSQKNTHFFGIVIGNQLLHQNTEIADRSDLANLKTHRQLELITTNKQPASIGICPKIPMGETYQGLDTLAAHEVNLLIPTPEYTGLVQLPQSQETITIDLSDERVTTPEEIEITPDLPSDTPESDLRITLSPVTKDTINLTTIDSLEALENEISILTITFPGQQEIHIQITDITPSNIEILLGFIQSLFSLNSRH